MEHFAEDLSFPIQHICDHKSQDITFPYGLEEVEQVMSQLGIPWETSKDVPFNSVVIFAGFTWDLNQKQVSLPDPKKEKYSQAISEWQQQPTHTLKDMHKLYRKLLYTCHIIP